MFHNHDNNVVVQNEFRNLKSFKVKRRAVNDMFQCRNIVGEKIIKNWYE